MKKPKLYWHIHHRSLLEPATEPIRNRIKFIREEKYASEVPIRLECLKPVKRPDLLPREVRLAAAKLGPNDWDASWCVFADTTRRHFKRIMARHRKEYPKCTCDPHGQLIFPGYGR